MKDYFLIFSVFLLGVSFTFAEHPGYTAYKKVCIVCHGPDGNGIPGGVFPPIKNSEWMKGDPKRAINIVVNGLEGALTVKGKTYNAVMPPQGAMLDNKTIADILNFVRSEWNKEKANVTPAMVQKVRDDFKMDHAWQAKALEKKFPIKRPKAKSPLQNLMVSFYEGKWSKMPDFSKLKPKSTEEWKKPISISGITKKKQDFGLVYEGKFLAEEAGLYMFDFGSDDGGIVYIDGKEVINHDGLHGVSVKKHIVKLKEGLLDFRLEYFQQGGGLGLSMNVKTPSKKRFQLTDAKLKAEALIPKIQLNPKEKAIVLRQFIRDSDARGIAVGHPEELHFTFDPHRMGPAVMWSGNFFNAGNPWTGRGKGYNPVYSEKRVVLKFRTYPFALLDDKNASWPTVSEKFKRELKLSSTSRDFSYRFKGYKLNFETGRPTFLYAYKGYSIEENYVPLLGSNSMKRIISIEGKATDKLVFQITQGLKVKLNEASVVDGDLTFMTTNEGLYQAPNKAVRVPVKFKDGKAEIVLTYKWEN